MSAVNGIGWNVEIFRPTLGWSPICGPFETKAEATARMKQFNAPSELRVYEALAAS